MTLADLLPPIRQLPRRDRLHLIRLITESLEVEEATPIPIEASRHYELLTPYDTYGAADLLMAALREAEADTHG